MLVSIYRKRKRPEAPLIMVRKAPGSRPHHGIAVIGYRHFRCRLGRAGIAVRKREGDGATPAGTLMIMHGYAVAHWRRLAFRFHRALISPSGLGWCDDPGDRNYNRQVRLPYPASHETLERSDNLYALCLVLDWNMQPRIRGCGSAIFLHLTPESERGTAGCVAFEPRDLRSLMRWLKPGTRLRVIPG